MKPNFRTRDRLTDIIVVFKIIRKEWISYLKKRRGAHAGGMCLTAISLCNTGFLNEYHVRLFEIYMDDYTTESCYLYPQYRRIPRIWWLTKHIWICRFNILLLKLKGGK